MATTYHINPRVRAYGKARIDITQRARDEDEWLDGWREPLHPFAFEFINNWKFNLEYKVDDFAAEVGFFIDILGFPVSGFSPSHAQFTTPDQEFTFSVAAALEEEESTNPETLRIQLMVDEIMETCEELEQRGISFEQAPHLLQDGSNILVGYFRTPHGIPIDLWGYKQEDESEKMSDDDIDQSLEIFSDWDESVGDESEPTPSVDSPPADEVQPKEIPSDIDPINQEEPSPELVYEDEEDPDLVNKLVDSFDRLRSSRTLSRFSTKNARSNRSNISLSNRSNNRSKDNEMGRTSSNPNIQGNLYDGGT